LDHLAHAFNIVQYFIIPKSEHSIAVCIQIGGARCIPHGIGPIVMLSSINFDNQPKTMARKIRKKWADRSLAAEMRSVYRQSTQVSPELSFGIGHVASQTARASYTTVA
jgi:hypothetical protein